MAVASVMVCSASYAAKPLSKQGKRVAKALMSTDPNEWQLVESIDLKFDTYHPQGMLKVDDTFYITTVKVTVFLVNKVLNRGRRGGYLNLTTCIATVIALVSAAAPVYDGVFVV